MQSNPGDPIYCVVSSSCWRGGDSGEPQGSWQVGRTGGWGKHTEEEEGKVSYLTEAGGIKPTRLLGCSEKRQGNGATYMGDGIVESAVPLMMNGQNARLDRGGVRHRIIPCTDAY